MYAKIPINTAAFDKHGIKRHHLFADNKQLLTSVTVTAVSVAKSNTEACVTDVQAWCASRRLQLNPSKREVIWLETRYRLQQLAGAYLNLRTDVIKPSTVVRDLGVLTDAELTLQQHVSKLTSSCFLQLWRLQEVRKYVNQQVLKQLVYAFIISRLDYYNCILAGLPKCAILQLQRVHSLC